MDHEPEQPEQAAREPEQPEQAAREPEQGEHHAEAVGEGCPPPWTPSSKV